MPAVWRVTLAVLILCLIASILIGTYRLVTTPTEILGDGFQGWRGERFPR